MFQHSIINKTLPSRRFAFFCFLFLLFRGLSFEVNAQNTHVHTEKCGTVAFEALRGEYSSYLKNQKRFEQWMGQARLQSRQKMRTLDTQDDELEVIQIPVVVHVIHNGEALNEGTNIPEGQILSQLETLNQDFRRTNPDTTQTLEIFKDVAADMRIEFILAKQDPEGSPSTGIVRKRGPRIFYNFNSDAELKTTSYWPAEDYVNIYVCNLSSGLLGYAQFPVSNLEGLEEGEYNRLTDGVAVDYQYFGTGFNADDFSRGRTLTHEIGHFLGLRHTWGDGGCDVDDFCDDTPTAAREHFGCPSGDRRQTCGSIDMVENYMDYTDDVCMNLFTNCQKERMRTVLENSPRRRTLKNSPGLIEPVQVALNMGIQRVKNPKEGQCNPSFAPGVVLRNYGLENINQVSIQYFVDGIPRQVLALDNLNVAPDDTLSINFAGINLPEPDTYTFEFIITSINNQSPDPEGINLSKTLEARYLEPISPPFVLNFEQPGTEIISRTDHQQQGWIISNAPRTNLENRAASINYFDNPVPFGSKDYLLTPVADLSLVSEAELKFKYAYSHLPGAISQELAVVVSTDCGNSFPVQNVLFSRKGNNLSTADQVSSSFIPSGPQDWEEISLSLDQFGGRGQVQIAFVSVFGEGNNIYLDDIELIAGGSQEINVELNQVIGLPIASCEASIGPAIEIRNLGSLPLESIEIHYEIGPFSSILFEEGLQVLTNQSTVIQLPVVELEMGVHEFYVQIKNPNGEEDPNPEDNEIRRQFLISDKQAQAPLRERLQVSSLQESDWEVLNPSGGFLWELFEGSQEDEKSIKAAGYQNTSLGQHSYFISPIMDFSELNIASIFFDVSYGRRSNIRDRLLVLGSTSCGFQFSRQLKELAAPELSLTESPGPWVPAAANHWKREYINLSELAGHSDVRLAFVFVNSGGNNLYLDNFEIFPSSNPNPIVPDNEVTLFPNPVKDRFQLAFNLERNQSVHLRVVNLSGRSMQEIDLEQVLNHTYEIECSSWPDGVYLLQIAGEDFSAVKKILVRNR